MSLHVSPVQSDGGNVGEVVGGAVEHGPSEVEGQEGLDRRLWAAQAAHRPPFVSTAQIPEVREGGRGCEVAFHSF